MFIDNFPKLKKMFKIPYIKFLNYSLIHKETKRYDHVKFLGKSIKVLKGSFSLRSDYDDAWLMYLSQNANIIFDVGCHMGKSAFIISQSDSLKKIFMIDPNPLSLSRASENLILNNMSENKMFICKAAYHKSGNKVKLWTMPGPFSGASIDIEFTQTSSIAKNYFEVDTTTLDDVANSKNSYPDLIKIDVEGAEYLVLKGAVEIAKKGNAKFIVEVHSAENLSIVENTDKILSWCKDNDYKAYYLTKHLELENPKLIENRGRYHLLLINKDKKYPQELKNIKQGEMLENIKARNFD